MNGPMLAFIFPETDSRKIPMEAILYWVQHGLMFINTIYLLRLEHSESGVRQYSVEPLFDWTWNIFSYACLMIYHFGLLVSLAVVSHCFSIFPAFRSQDIHSQTPPPLPADGGEFKSHALSSTSGPLQRTELPTYRYHPSSHSLSTDVQDNLLGLCTTGRTIAAEEEERI